VVKILSQSGDSLADMYEAEGSIAGIDQLITRELPIVHEMGATVFSERYRATFRRSTSGAINQSTAFNMVITNLPLEPTRLLGLAVISNNTGRVDRVAVMVRFPNTTTQDIPIWVWDGSTTQNVEMDDNGGGVVTHGMFIGDAHSMIPNMIGGGGQSAAQMDAIACRGESTAFGAGTVTVTVLYYFAFAPPVGNIGSSSYGVPIPGW